MNNTFMEIYTASIRFCYNSKLVIASLLTAFVIFSSPLRAQNAIVGTGFSSGWGGGSCPTGNTNFTYLSTSAGTSYIYTGHANATGTQYWRFGVDWSGTTAQYTNTNGSNTAVTPNTQYSLTTTCTTNGALNYNVPSTSYNYIFKTLNAGTAPTGTWVFFEVQGTVQTVSSVTQVPASSAVYNSQSVVVTANLSGALSTGQAVYLRYTTNGYSTSTVVNMTGSGTAYTATIPAFASGTAVSYYVFTSGPTGGGLASNGSNADLFTINLNNNGGSNYTYTVAAYPSCTPSSTSSSTYINSFSTTGGTSNITNNTTGYTTGGYKNYAPTVYVTQTQGGAVNWSVTIAGGTAGIGIWVDWNQNGVFTDAGENVYNSGAFQSSGTYTGSFTVPSGAVIGSTSMRVLTDYNASTPVPCSISGTRGEAEDYAFNVTAPPAPTITSFTPTALCSGGGQTVTITGTNFTAITSVKFNGTAAASYTVVSSTSITAVVPSGVTAGSITVTNSGGTATSSAYTVTPVPTITTNPSAQTVTLYTTGTGTGTFTVATSTGSPTYQWQYGTSSTGPWSNVADGTPTGVTYGGTGTAASLTAIAGSTATAGSAYYYQCVVTAGGCSSTSSSAQFTINNYCASTGTASASSTYITNVTLTGATTLNNTTGYTANGYTFYSTPTVSQIPGGSVSYSATIFGVSGGVDVGIWVDWNNNGVFTDAGEHVVTAGTGTQITTNPSGTFTVPTGQAVGSYRIRIVDNYAAATAVSCNSGITGETEDYIFNVTAPPTPTITSFTPTALCSAGGQTVTITGTNFTGATAVKFNGTAAASFTVVSATSITAVTPASLTAGNITVTNSAGTATSPSAYTVTTTPTAGITGTTPACGSITLTATPASGVTYAWSNSGGSASTATYSASGTYTVTVTSSGCTGTASLAVTVNAAVNITTQPSTAAQTVCAGSAVTALSVAATGTGLTYQWYSNAANSNSGGTLITGATSASYTPSNTYTTGAPTYYYCIVSGTAPCTAVTSNVSGGITINQSPTITSSPSATSVNAFAAATTSFTVATSAGSPTYQWQYATTSGGTYTNVADGTPTGITYGGTGTAATLSIISANTATAGTGNYYRCVVTAAGCSTTSGNAQLTINNYCKPSSSSSAYFINNFSTTGGVTNITNNGSGYSTGGYGNFTSQSVSQYANSAINFSITGDGGGTYTYGFAIWVDWNNNGTFETGEQMYVTSGYATSTTGSFTVPSGTAAGSYRMRVFTDYYNSAPNNPCAFSSTGPYGEAEDYIVTVVIPAVPTITSFTPTALCSVGGQTVTITGTNFTGATAVAFNGTAATSYTVVSATSITAVSPSGVSAGNITVTTSGGTATSPSAYTVTTNPTAAITGTTPACGSITLTATPSTGVTYAWSSSGGSASTATYSASGTYTVTVTLSGCTGTASKAVTVNAAVNITTQPSTAAQTVCSGSTVTALSVAATGTGLTYQWYSNTTNSNSGGTLITGATSASYTPSNAYTTGVPTYYYCVVSGTAPCTAVASNVSGGVTINQTPTVPALTGGASTVCVGSTTPAFADATAGGVWTITAGTGTATVSAGVVTGTGAGTVTVVYTVTNSGCSASASSSVTVNAAPTAVTVTPASALVCNGTITTLTGSGGGGGSATALSEGFEGGGLPTGWVRSNNGAFTYGDWENTAENASTGNTWSAVHSGSNCFFFYTYLINSGSTGTLETPAMDLSTYSAASLSFWVYNSSGTDKLRVYAKQGSGTYTQLNSTAYGVYGSWTQVTINLSSYIGSGFNAVKIQFQGTSDFGSSNIGLDDVSVTGTLIPTYTWTPTTGLYTDAAATTAYSGSALTTVYAKPTTTQTYTATYTNGSGCTATNTAVITVNQPSTAPTGISATNSTVCNGSGTTLTATGGTLGTGATYQWGTGSVVGTNPISGATGATYSVTPSATTTYWVSITGSAPCGSPTGGATTTITVNNPSVAPTGISGTVSVCSGVGTTLTATGGTLGTGANYQWGTGSVIGTSPITGATSVTYSVTPSSTTTYWVSVTGSGVCGSPSGGATTTVTVTPNQWTGAISSDWTVGGNWCSGIAPLSTTDVSIPNAGSVSNSPVIGLNASASAVCNNLTLASGASLTMSSTYSSTLTLSAGASFTNNASSSAFTAGTGTVAFASNGTINGSSATSFNNLTINSGTLTLTTVPTINGNFTINGGNVSTAPTYGSSSTLIYNTTYTTFNEWSGSSSSGATISAGTGTPKNVTINAAVTMTTAARALAGNMTIGSAGSLSLSTTSGADLFVGGNWTRNSGGSFTPNGRAVWFQNASTQTISSASGSESFSYLLVDKSANNLVLSNSPATSVTINSTTGDVLQLLNTGSLDLNGQSLTLTGNGGNIKVSGGARYLISSTPATININGNKYVTSASSGTLGIGTSSASNVTMQVTGAGIDFGSGLTTIYSTLQINAGGYVANNAPLYYTNSNLIYSTGGYYGRNVEFGSLSSFGYPYNVIIQNGTTLDLSANSPGNLALAGNLTIGNSGSASLLTMGAMIRKLTVGGNVLIGSSGTLTQSTAVGGDIEVNGNWTRNSGGTYNQNSRAVFFIGGLNSTITCAAGEAFDYLFISKTNSTYTVTLANDVTVYHVLNLNTGIVNTGTNKIIITSNASGAVTGNSASSYINGNIRRYVTASGNYDLPVGTASSYQLANITFASTALGGTTYLDAKFNSGTPTAPVPTSCIVNNRKIGSVLPTGSWTITPDVQPSGGATYTATLNMTGISSGLPSSYVNQYGTTVTPAQQIALVKRDAGVNSGNWTGTGLNGGSTQPYGTHTNTTQTVGSNTAKVTRSGVPSFSDFAIGVEQNQSWALPVKLLFFTAENTDNNGVLAWATATETDNDHFDVERSLDGVSFEKIGQVAGHDNSAQTINYGYNDADLSSHNVNVIYYRLKQVDIDGNFQYSNIASVNVSADQQNFHIISTYPNPFADHFSVSFFSPALQPVRMSVYDIRGSLVSEETISAAEGMNIYSIPGASHLASGFYTMNITVGDKTYGIKMLKGE